jgi:hypothetical protein
VLESLLRETNTRRDVPIRATAFAFRDADPRMTKVVVAIEPAEPGTTLTSAAFALIDLGGKSAAQWTEEGANVVTRPLITAAAVPSVITGCASRCWTRPGCGEPWITSSRPG